jgi:LTXXQ motif family protein
MRGPGRMAGPCGPQGGSFGEAMLDRLERATRPTAEQRPAFDRLKDAVTKAAGIVRAACPAERALTPTGRLAAAEQRLTARLEAVRTVRPAMDAFYGSLSDEQKARLLMARGHMGPMGGPESFRGGEWGGRRGGEWRDRRGGGTDGRREGWGGRERGGDRRGDRTTYDNNDDAAMPERL